MLNIDLPNVQNIQVLKGPQSTLLGRNATGGAILIDTLDPTRTTTGQIEATYARFNHMRFRGCIADRSATASASAWPAQNLSGLQMSRAPNFTAFVGFDYKVPLHTGSLLIAANIKHTDSYVVTNPSVWGGEPLASYEYKHGTRPRPLRLAPASRSSAPATCRTTASTSPASLMPAAPASNARARSSTRWSTPRSPGPTPPTTMISACGAIT